jgi:heme-degrading monooxygenase HmoA
MILALSRFRVKNGMEDAVREAFVHRPRRVEQVGGFCGLDVYTDTRDPSAFMLLTRWLDEESFRAWHSSPEHHASHALMPPGMKLDPRGTELVVANRVEGAASGGLHGDMLLDFALPIVTLLQTGAALHLLEVHDGVIVRANRVFETTAKRPLSGVLLTSIVVPASLEAISSAAGSNSPEPFLVQFRDADQALTLRCVVQACGGRLLLAGEPPLDHHRALEEQLFAINAELSTLMRENARQARALEDAYRRLKDESWHLSKVSDVLPMCLECRKVRTGSAEDSWETVETFLQRSSTFLSHGYCARCAQRLEDELDRKEGSP